ncbi:MAG: hypothetical protein B6I17_04560 [Tenericutes bacterium 4572_104]|nr:MAG: hypothetical protein B6I17_04560 [Tenericutes bacterium 4572_104]
MILSQDQLNNIEKYSSLFFSYKEIAILMKLDVEIFIDFVTDNNTEIYKSYQRGKLISEAELREQIVKLAKMGSPAAQQEAFKLIDTQKIKEITNV